MLARRAVEADPAGSQAHACYAYCCFVTQMAIGQRDRDQLRVEAIEFAKRAVTLDTRGPTEIDIPRLLRGPSWSMEEFWPAARLDLPI